MKYFRVITLGNGDAGFGIDGEVDTTAASKYQIETAESINGPWTVVYEKTDGVPVLEMSEEFADVQARYVKLTAYEKMGPWGYSFWEFEVYGY